MSVFTLIYWNIRDYPALLIAFFFIPFIPFIPVISFLRYFNKDKRDERDDAIYAHRWWFRVDIISDTDKCPVVADSKTNLTYDELRELQRERNVEVTNVRLA